jgi:hypothetical protein
LNEGLHEVAGPLFVRLLSCSFYASEGYNRLSVRLLRRHSGVDVCLGLLLDVKLQLFVYFTMGLGAHQKAKTP